jgi:hypothetical protein
MEQEKSTNDISKTISNMENPTIKQAQHELSKITEEFSAQLTEFEQRYGVELAYTAFVDHASDGAVQLRFTAKL